jgi:hypothetical protein
MAKNSGPFELSRQIDQQLDCLYKLAARQNSQPREKALLTEPKPRPDKPSLQRPRTGAAWRDWTFTKKQKRQRYKSSDNFAHKLT